MLAGFISPNTLPGKFNVLGKPFWKVRELTTESLSGFLNTLNSKTFLVTENKRLQNELHEATKDTIKMKLLLKENEDLKNILGRRSESKRILARVLSKAGQSPYGTLIIDIGESEISKNQEVFSGNSILIGLVDEVYESTAKVKLLSAPGNRYEVEIGEDAIPGLALGLGGGNFEIELPRGIDIEVEDEIISPALSIKFLGIVEHIDSKPQNSFQKILFKSPININQIKWVEVEVK